MMEAILVLPLLLMLTMGIVQFARLWQARLMTWYAAYNAARAALVYHPGEYREDDTFFADRGVAWMAAVQTLAWTSHTDDSDSFDMPSFGRIPNSSDIMNQVRIVPDKSWERDGMVRVTVEFDFPTIFTVFDFADIIAPKNPEPLVEEAWGLLNAPTFKLTETCILPKPWTTATFPRLSDAEKGVLLTR